MKKIAKTFILILSIVCLAAFAACGNNNKNSSNSSNAMADDSGWTGNY